MALAGCQTGAALQQVHKALAALLWAYLASASKQLVRHHRGTSMKHSVGQSGLSVKPPWCRLPIYALTGLMFPIIGLFELKRYQGFKETGNVSVAASLHA